MRTMRGQRGVWLKAAMVAGLLLGILLVIESVVTYRSVTGQLVPDHLNRQAGRYVSALESEARQQRPETRADLQALVDGFRRQESEAIAWIRITDQEGQLLASSGDTGGYKISRRRLRDVLGLQTQSVTEAIPTPNGEALVVALPFRYRLVDAGPGPPRGAGTGRPRFNFAEVALLLHGATDLFWPLLRNLVVSISAAIALVASMAVIFLRFPRYLRGRTLEDQLALARRVQQESLPSDWPSCEHLEFCARCIPAFEVGGDYYDVLPREDGQIGLVLGDVSGKGLPAALLMGTLHGAVRAYSGFWNKQNHSEIAGKLNELLYVRTSKERFASLFWAFFDPLEQTLRYVNAGHLPPLVARRIDGREIEIVRLDKGGPVLGLLPAAAYEHGEAALKQGDLLVLYSDGVLEAANAADEEFGEERVIQVMTAQWDRRPDEICEAILKAILDFTGTAELQDDLTMFVARIGQPPAGGQA